jgi:hypothetical protein
MLERDQRLANNIKGKKSWRKMKEKNAIDTKKSLERNICKERVGGSGGGALGGGNGEREGGGG